MSNSLDARLAEIADAFAAVDAVDVVDWDEDDFDSPEFREPIAALDAMCFRCSSTRTDEVVLPSGDWLRVIYNDDSGDVLGIAYGDPHYPVSVEPDSSEGRMIRRFVANFTLKGNSLSPQGSN